MDKSIWPASDEEELSGGWTLSVNFLKAIQQASRNHGAEASLEDVEGVLLAAEAYAILEVNKKP